MSDYIYLHERIDENHIINSFFYIINTEFYQNMSLAKIYFYFLYFRVIIASFKTLKTTDLIIKTDIIGLRDKENSEYWQNPNSNVLRNNQSLCLNFSSN